MTPRPLPAATLERPAQQGTLPSSQGVPGLPPSVIVSTRSFSTVPSCNDRCFATVVSCQLLVGERQQHSIRHVKRADRPRSRPISYLPSSSRHPWSVVCWIRFLNFCRLPSEFILKCLACGPRIQGSMRLRITSAVYMSPRECTSQLLQPSSSRSLRPLSLAWYMFRTTSVRELTVFPLKVLTDLESEISSTFFLQQYVVWLEVAV